MKKQIIFAVAILIPFLKGYSQVAGKLYNSYRIEDKSVTLNSLLKSSENFNGQLKLNSSSRSAISQRREKVFIEVGFSPQFVNSNESKLKPVLGKHVDQLLPDDLIDSISLNCYYQGKAVEYKFISNLDSTGYYVENKNNKSKSWYHNHAFPIKSLSEFKEKYNNRDTLFAASSIMWYDLLIEFQYLLPSNSKDILVIFFIKFKDGRIIQKVLK